ncbi:hypothetical protein [Clostridium estertheticum]|uniref:hypothetical protein n=1 Tax=Clostridium estertheticum TaxID=238834 RepID=UPI001CF4D5EA|nr:hypothetical protein [Clostridium estertheticum]MCB2361974.1 hypothetical protein [Clostridium estertheticum]
MKLETKINLIKNTLSNSQYITKGRLEKFLKHNNYCSTEECDYNEEMSKRVVADVDKTILELQEYEYDKNYKYFSLYEFDDEDILKKINELKKLEKINKDDNDYWSYTMEKPTVKEYENKMDIKFSLLLKEREIRENLIKYTVIVTIFKVEKLVCIKYYSVSEEFYESEFYININNGAKRWIEHNLDIVLKEFDSMKIFKSLYNSIKNNNNQHEYESIHSILMDDEMNGRSYFKASDTGMLPFLSQLGELAQTFESKEDKEKLIKYVTRYEDEAIIRNIAIKWEHKFSNSRGRVGNITVGINKIYSVNNAEDSLKYEFTLHHIRQNEGINRERINYVIEFLSKYSNGIKE